MAKISKEEFLKTYTTKIEPFLGELEQERIIVRKKSKPFEILLAICVLLEILWFISYKFSLHNVSWIGIVLVFIIILAVIRLIVLTGKLIDNLKQNVISKILFIYGNLYFAGKKDIITDAEIRKMGLFPQFTSKCDDDIIIGIHKQCNFVISETSLSHTEHYGRTTRSVTDFNGLIIKVQMNKNFSGRTVIGMKNYIKKPDRTFEQVELESTDFMKNRCVYSTDQIDARYILTTSFMERIESLGQDFQEERSAKSQDPSVMANVPLKTGVDFVDNIFKSYYGVSAAFIDGYAYLFVPTSEDFFEIPIDKSLYNPDLYYNIWCELDSILGIIEYLHIDQKTGL